MGSPSRHRWRSALVPSSDWFDEGCVIPIIKTRLSVKTSIRITGHLRSWWCVLSRGHRTISTLTIRRERHLDVCGRRTIFFLAGARGASTKMMEPRRKRNLRSATRSQLMFVRANADCTLAAQHGCFSKPTSYSICVSSPTLSPELPRPMVQLLWIC